MSRRSLSKLDGLVSWFARWLYTCTSTNPPDMISFTRWATGLGGESRSIFFTAGHGEDWPLLVNYNSTRISLLMSPSNITVSRSIEYSTSILTAHLEDQAKWTGKERHKDDIVSNQRNTSEAAIHFEHWYAWHPAYPHHQYFHSCVQSQVWSENGHTSCYGLFHVAFLSRYGNSVLC